MDAKDWEGRLEIALQKNDLGAARLIADRLIDDREQRTRMLDLVAEIAANGSTVARDLLIEIVDRSGLARASVARILVNEDDVDDTTQDTLESVSKSISRFDPERGSFVTWLFKIARNRSVDHLRRSGDETSLPADFGDAYKISSMIASNVTVQRLVNKLSLQFREAVIARDLERLSYDETAKRLGIPLNTAKSHVRRGRAQLKAWIDEAEL